MDIRYYYSHIDDKKFVKLFGTQGSMPICYTELYMKKKGENFLSAFDELSQQYSDVNHLHYFNKIEQHGVKILYFVPIEHNILGRNELGQFILGRGKVLNVDMSKPVPLTTLC